MTFDKQSNGRRTAVESKSNRSCYRSVVSDWIALPCSLVFKRYSFIANVVQLLLIKIRGAVIND